jgi:saccharopepsin
MERIYCSFLVSWSPVVKHLLNSTFAEMLSSVVLSLLILPFVNAGDGMHRMKLKKLAQTAPGSAQEAALLAQKYGGQVPLAGAGGFGRKFASPPTSKDEDLFWTQDIVANGGHGVPLSSTSAGLL